MGQDLIMEDIIIRDKPTIAFGKKLEKALIKKLGKMSEDDLMAWGEEVCCGESKVEIIVRAKRLIKSVISNIQQGGCRDTTYITIPLYPYAKDKYYYVFITGGMSFGDSPGESFDEFVDFNKLFHMYRFIDEVLEEK